MRSLSAFNFFAVAAAVVLAMFLFNSAAASRDGSMATISEDEIAMKFKMIAENERQEGKMSVLAAMYRRMYALKEAENKQRMGVLNDEKALQCKPFGTYCNNAFQVTCCSGWWGCIPQTGLAGGICAF